ncbi:unnamed protein product [Strongylus vulgaris]|uniref:Uncharacterized protein n=1 Tax=Strongylus vulgaris TaxID=40348 RepID=A0A3P7KVE3_STRVU|nr:unnamed protein product [Strongylus vulgaris]
MDSATKVLYDLGEELMNLNFGALTPGYYLNEKLIKIVDDFLPEDITPAQGRLYVSLTIRKERKNHLVCQFKNREHLLQCLMASCYIPMYSMGYGAEPPIIDGHVSTLYFIIYRINNTLKVKLILWFNCSSKNFTGIFLIQTTLSQK